MATREPTMDESATTTADEPAVAAVGDALSESIAASPLSPDHNAQETTADGTASGVAAAATDAVVGGDAPQLSKRAQKRLLKQQSQVEKRKAEKQAKKEAKRAKREQAQAEWEAMPAEEQARVRAEAHARGEREQRRQAALREKEAKAAAAAALSADGADGSAPLEAGYSSCTPTSARKDTKSAVVAALVSLVFTRCSEHTAQCRIPEEGYTWLGESRGISGNLGESRGISRISRIQRVGARHCLRS